MIDLDAITIKEIETEEELARAHRGTSGSTLATRATIEAVATTIRRTS